MKCMEAIRVRHSTRSFSGEPLEDEMIRRILEAGTLAPSAKNRQPWRFSIVTDSMLRSSIADAMEKRALEMGSLVKTRCGGKASQTEAPGEREETVSSIKAGSLLDSARCIREAPCTVFVRYAFDESWSEGNEKGWSLETDDLEAVDLLGIGACVENMSLAATSMGVSSLWNCDVLYVGSFVTSCLGGDEPIVAALVLGLEGGRGSSEDLPIRIGRMPVDEVSKWY